MNNENVTAVVFAARLSDSMNSKTNKLLYNLCGKPMAGYAIDAAVQVSGSRPVVVANDEADMLQEVFGDKALYSEIGSKELLPPVCLSAQGYIVILPADMPLISAQSIEMMVQMAAKKDVGACALLSEDDKVKTGSAYCFDTAILKKAIAHGCRAFSDCVEYFADNGYGAEAIFSDECDVVTDRIEFAKVQAKMRERINNRLLKGGVTLMDPSNTYIDYDVEIGMDTIVYPGVTIEGNSEIGDDCILYPGSRIVDSCVGNGTIIQNSVMTQAQVGDNTTIGPYAYLRPKAVIGNGCKVGDFVEVKNAVMKDGSKASHLTYIGDGEVGEKSNIGCGVIFCNYDGKKKSRTIVGKNAFIGSNVNLVAPVKVGDGAFVAAGTTATADIQEDALCIGRSKQKIIEGWAKKWWEK